MSPKWVKVVTVCALAVGACGGGEDETAPPSTSPTETSTSSTTAAPATTATPTTAPPTTAPPEPATALAVIDSLAAAGLPIGTTVEYTDVTDPNENLGRPGQYIAKAGWIDTRVDCALDEPGWDCGGDVELFDNPDDLDNRWNYLTGFADTPPIGGFYMWRSDTAIVRVGFVIAPSLAHEYQAALGTILGGVEALEELPVPATTTTTTTTRTTTPTTTLPAISLDEVVFVLNGPFSNYVRTLPSERSSDEVLAALQTLPLDQPIAGAEEIVLAPPAELLGDDVPLHVFLTQLFGVADGSIRLLGLDYRIKDLIDKVPTMGPPLITRRSNTVGSDVSPGTYVTFDVNDCYWETLDDTGEINDNNFISSAPRVEVTIRESDFAFNSRGCGSLGSYTEDWVQL